MSTPKKPTILYLFLFILIYSCSEKTLLDEEEANVLEIALGAKSQTPPFEGPFVFFKDLSYAAGPRNKLDLFLPKSEKIKGVVLFFHGGAFLFGTKETLYEDEFKDLIEKLLDENIAVVNSEYTFINDPDAEGVFTSLEDGTKVIQFIKEKSNILNLPENQLILAGVSAGAGIAQWNGFREETNSSIKGVVAIIAQSSYDLYQWEQLFPDFSLDRLRKTEPELEELLLRFYNGEPTPEKATVLDYRSEMDADDPALFVYNPVYEENFITLENTIDFNVLFHSYKHADFLRKKASEVGLEYSGAYQESPLDFILRKLNN